MSYIALLTTQLRDLGEETSHTSKAVGNLAEAIRGGSVVHTVCPAFRYRRIQIQGIGGTLMRRLILAFALVVAFACLTLLHFTAARVIAAAPTPNVAQITAGPELESLNESIAIIRWTTTNPGGTDLHYGIVHYGTDAMNLSQVAKSPNCRNPSHADMIFRVRIAGLNPETTYYYTVESTGATGVNDSVSSLIRTFKTK
jgi:phosphodiesterase/alkaline phosphatase D-like protein